MVSRWRNLLSSLTARYFSVLTNISNNLLSKDYNPPLIYEQVKALKPKWFACDYKTGFISKSFSLSTLFTVFHSVQKQRIRAPFCVLLLWNGNVSMLGVLFNCLRFFFIWVLEKAKCPWFLWAPNIFNNNYYYFAFIVNVVCYKGMCFKGIIYNWLVFKKNKMSMSPWS